MKKISFIVLGLSLIISGFVSLGEASREAYHAYLSENGSKYRSDNKRILRVRYDSIKKAKSLYHVNQRIARGFRNSSGRNVNETQAEKVRRRIRERFANNPNYKRKVFTSRKNPWQQPLKRINRVISPKIISQNSTYNLVNYTNDTFAIQIPKGWMTTKNTEHVFVNPYTDYTVSIERFETPCTNNSFMECGIALSKSLNNGSLGPILPTSSITRLSYFSNTISQSRIQTETMTEGFSANIFGKRMYIARYFVSDLEENVYIIKTMVPLNDVRNSIPLSKQIFDSFRILR